MCCSNAGSQYALVTQQLLDQVLGSFQPQLYQTRALANANVALEMLRGFSSPLS